MRVKDAKYFATVQVWDEPIELRLPPPLPDEQPLQVAASGAGQPCCCLFGAGQAAWLVQRVCSVIAQPFNMRLLQPGGTQLPPIHHPPHCLHRSGQRS